MPISTNKISKYTTYFSILFCFISMALDLFLLWKGIKMCIDRDAKNEHIYIYCSLVLALTGVVLSLLVYKSLNSSKPFQKPVSTPAKIKNTVYKVCLLIIFSYFIVLSTITVIQSQNQLECSTPPSTIHVVCLTIVLIALSILLFILFNIITKHKKYYAPPAEHNECDDQEQKRDDNGYTESTPPQPPLQQETHETHDEGIAELTSSVMEATADTSLTQNSDQIGKNYQFEPSPINLSPWLSDGNVADVILSNDHLQRAYTNGAKKTNIKPCQSSINTTNIIKMNHDMEPEVLIIQPSNYASMKYLRDIIFEHLDFLDNLLKKLQSDFSICSAKEDVRVDFQVNMNWKNLPKETLTLFSEATGIEERNNKLTQLFSTKDKSFTIIIALQGNDTEYSELDLLKLSTEYISSLNEEPAWLHVSDIVDKVLDGLAEKFYNTKKQRQHLDSIEEEQEKILDAIPRLESNDYRGSLNFQDSLLSNLTKYSLFHEIGDSVNEIGVAEITNHEESDARQETGSFTIVDENDPHDIQINPTMSEQLEASNADQLFRQNNTLATNGWPDYFQFPMNFPTTSSSTNILMVKKADNNVSVMCKSNENILELSVDRTALLNIIADMYPALRTHMITLGILKNDSRTNNIVFQPKGLTALELFHLVFHSPNQPPNPFSNTNSSSLTSLSYTFTFGILSAFSIEKSYAQAMCSYQARSFITGNRLGTFSDSNHLKRRLGSNKINCSLFYILDAIHTARSMFEHMQGCAHQHRKNRIAYIPELDIQADYISDAEEDDTTYLKTIDTMEQGSNVQNGVNSLNSELTGVISSTDKTAKKISKGVEPEPDSKEVNYYDSINGANGILLEGFTVSPTIATNSRISYGVDSHSDFGNISHHTSNTEYLMPKKELSQQTVIDTDLKTLSTVKSNADVEEVKNTSSNLPKGSEFTPLTSIADSNISNVLLEIHPNSQNANKHNSNENVSEQTTITTLEPVLAIHEINHYLADDCIALNIYELEELNSRSRSNTLKAEASHNSVENSIFCTAKETIANSCEAIIFSAATKTTQPPKSLERTKFTNRNSTQDFDEVDALAYNCYEIFNPRDDISEVYEAEKTSHYSLESGDLNISIYSEQRNKTSILYQEILKDNATICCSGQYHTNSITVNDEQLSNYSITINDEQLPNWEVRNPEEVEPQEESWGNSISAIKNTEVLESAASTYALKNNTSTRKDFASNSKMETMPASLEEGTGVLKNFSSDLKKMETMPASLEEGTGVLNNFSSDLKKEKSPSSLMSGNLTNSSENLPHGLVIRNSRLNGYPEDLIITSVEQVRDIIHNNHLCS